MRVRERERENRGPNPTPRPYIVLDRGERGKMGGKLEGGDDGVPRFHIPRLLSRKQTNFGFLQGATVYVPFRNNVYIRVR